MLTAGGDGCIRIVSILPNKLIGVLGSHDDDEPIEDMALSPDKQMLATIAHDSVVQLWSLAALHESDGGSDGGDAAAAQPEVVQAKVGTSLPAEQLLTAHAQDSQAQEGAQNAVHDVDLLQQAGTTGRQKRKGEAADRAGKQKHKAQQQNNFFADLL